MPTDANRQKQTPPDTPRHWQELFEYVWQSPSASVGMSCSLEMSGGEAQVKISKDGKTCKLENGKMCRYDNGKMWKYQRLENVQIRKWENVQIGKWENVQIEPRWKCQRLENVQIWISAVCSLQNLDIAIFSLTFNFCCCYFLHTW